MRLADIQINRSHFMKVILHKEFYAVCKKTCHISFPLICTNLISSSMGIMSMYFISLLGHKELAAGAIISTTYTLLIMMPFSILYSVGILTATKHAENNIHDVIKIIRHGLILATLLSIPVILVMRNIDIILLFFRQPSDIAQIVSTYYRSLSYSILPSLYCMVFNQFMIGILRPVVVTIFALIALIFSTILSIILLFGKCGVPPLGISGVGYAITIVSWASLISTVLFILINERYHQYNIFKYKFEYSKDLLIKLHNIGWPIGLQSFSEILAITFATYLIGTLGIRELDAQQITLQCSILSVMITTGISQSTTILIRKVYTHNQLRSVNSQYLVSLLLVTIANLILSLIFIFCPRTLISIFIHSNSSSNSSIAILTTSLLSIVAFTRIFDGIRNVTASALRGIDEKLTPMLTAIFSNWLLAVPLGLLLMNTYGAAGIRIGFLIGVATGAIILIFFFHIALKKIEHNVTVLSLNVVET